MTNEPNFPPMFRIDVSADSNSQECAEDVGVDEVIVALLRQLVVGQERQQKVLEDLAQQTGQAQKQRAQELGQWKEANPELARNCRRASEALSQAQSQFLSNLTEEIAEQADSLMDGEFMLNEFVDRFGPRLAHLNGLLQALSQLSSVPEAHNTAS